MIKEINFKNTTEHEGIDVESTCWFNEPIKYLENDLEYQNWFDSCKNVKDSLQSGYIDFFTKILTPDLYQYTGDVKNQTCLEIGFGGCRITNAASKVFKKCVGIDILSEECVSKSKSFIDNDENVKLYHFSEKEKIQNDSIDFVYSFIVFQHFTKLDYIFDYFDLFSLKMKKGAVGNVFFGFNKFDNNDFYFDKDFKSRECSLFVKPEFIAKELTKRNMSVIEAGVTTKAPWKKDISGQFYVKFIKN